MTGQTIAAISTAKGEGSIAVIRISGKEAITIADKCFVSVSGKKLCELSGYSAAFGEAVRAEGSRIDEAVALVFKAPKSYTGEDVVELSVHGGSVAANECLKSVFTAGAYPAEAGEFTKRAFLNGKIDLTEAESVMEIISARSAAALTLAKSAKDGKISRDIEKITERLLAVAASLCAYSDFPDEDIEGLDFESFNKMLNESSQSLDSLLKTFGIGQAVLSGVPTAIVGKPNVGKSTLMNALSGEDRSIVTSVAGTTRDIVEAQVNTGTVTLLLSDTAGIHKTEDEIENIGVERAKNRLNNSALVIAVFDVSRPFDDDDRAIIRELNGKSSIAVLNKADLPKMANISLPHGIKTVTVSAKNNDGIEKLKEEIEKICGTDRLTPNDTVLINERQYSCAARAKTAVDKAKEAFLSGITLDAVTVLIDDAVNALLELSGKKATQSVTEEIFSRFCVGK
ncbi:MAG: tRNA uridine-5-carboxymethylaminomethyl(34) synthesis GTPase MnmE [Clostridia bacterium]|nr:tRNA uridine-5-carboxymethylaminomethyl(34) synthesis GTPase MnmE [Clostridia bacterium]